MRYARSRTNSLQSYSYGPVRIATAFSYLKQNIKRHESKGMNFQQAITYTKYSVILLEGVSFVDSQQSPHGSELLAIDMANYLPY